MLARVGALSHFFVLFLWGFEIVKKKKKTGRKKVRRIKTPPSSQQAINYKQYKIIEGSARKRKKNQLVLAKTAAGNSGATNISFHFSAAAAAAWGTGTMFFLPLQRWMTFQKNTLASDINISMMMMITPGIIMLYLLVCWPGFQDEGVPYLFKPTGDSKLKQKSIKLSEN